MTACTHFQVVELGEEGSRFKATLRANNTEIQYKFKEQQRGLSGGAECSPLIKRYHLLFTPHRYLAGILCEENETNARELLYPFKLQALFFFFQSPDELSVTSRTFRVYSFMQLETATNFSHLFLTPDVEAEEKLEAFQGLVGHLPP